MRLGSLLSLRGRSLMLAGMMLLATAAVPFAASAHFMGWPNGHWVRPGTWALNLYYSRGCSGGFFTAAGEAGSNWTATPTPVYYNITGNPPACDGTPWYGYVDLYTFSNSTSSAWGYAQAYSYLSVCDLYFWGVCLSSHMALIPDWSDHYNSGVITLNTAKINSTNYFLQVGDVTHEMGHILGLAHSGYYAGESTGYYSIMDYLNWSYNKPKQHDYNDVNALYP